MYSPTMPPQLVAFQNDTISFTHILWLAGLSPLRKKLNGRIHAFKISQNSEGMPLILLACARVHVFLLQTWLRLWSFPMT